MNDSTNTASYVGGMLSRRMKEEIFVRYLHETAGRPTSGAVSWSEYARMWKRNFLMFQREGTEKPEHYPTLEEAEALARELRQEDTPRPTRFFPPEEKHRGRGSFPILKNEAVAAKIPPRPPAPLPASVVLPKPAVKVSKPEWEKVRGAYKNKKANPTEAPSIALLYTTVIEMDVAGWTLHKTAWYFDISDALVSMIRGLKRLIPEVWRMADSGARHPLTLNEATIISRRSSHEQQELAKKILFHPGRGTKRK